MLSGLSDGLVSLQYLLAAMRHLVCWPPPHFDIPFVKCQSPQTGQRYGVSFSLKWSQRSAAAQAVLNLT